jgi:hypothetical protein
MNKSGKNYYVESNIFYSVCLIINSCRSLISNKIFRDKYAFNVQYSFP